MGRLPAVLLDLRVVDPDLGLARAPLLGEAQMGQRRAVEIERIALDQLGRRHRAVVVLEERLGHRGLRVRQPVVQTIAPHP